MKNSINSAILIMAIFATGLLFNSCTKKESNSEKPKGLLKLNVGISVVESTVGSHFKASSADFSVKIFNSGDQAVLSYAHVSEVPSSIELQAGSYYAVVSSDNNQPAAFNNPYYYGNSGTFTITAGQTSSVNVTCSLANIMVTVVYSDQVINSFSNYSTTVSNTGGNLAYAKDETRAGYFNAGPLHIESTLTYTDGGGVEQTKTLTGDISNAQTGKHYEIHIDAAPTKGNAVLDVTLNETVVTEVVNITDNSNSGNWVPAFGDLLITEIMYNPLALSDTEGEWIEVYNNSGHAINLKDLVIRRGSATTFHQISTDVNLAAGAYAVLGRTSTAASHVDYVYPSINLTNTGDEIIINTYGTTGMDGTIICSVDYSLTGFLTNLNGKSLQLDPSVHDAAEAQIGSNWCASTVTYSTGDYGTPGAANSNCQ